MRQASDAASGLLEQARCVIAKSGSNESLEGLAKSGSNESLEGLDAHDQEGENGFGIHCISSARTFYFTAGSPKECDDWVMAIGSAKMESEKAHHRRLNSTWLSRLRAFAARTYDHPNTQLILNFIILSNFVCNILETELVSTQDDHNESRRKGVKKTNETNPTSSGSEAEREPKTSLEHTFDTIDMVLAHTLSHT